MGGRGGGRSDAERGRAKSGTESPAQARGLPHDYRSIPVEYRSTAYDLW